MDTQALTRRLLLFIPHLVKGISHPRLTATSVRRSRLYRPLAILLSLLMLPSLPFPEGGKGPRPFQASAQVIGSCAPGGNHIIQNVCANGVVFADDLNQLETDSVNTYLGIHNLPATDAHVIYDDGRADLRNAVRATMLATLLAVIGKPASSRTAHENNLVTWFQTVVQLNEIAEYTSAIAEYHNWQNNPCVYTLDPQIASANGITYDGAPFCSPFNVIFNGLPVPASSYFLSYGLKNSYGKSALTFPDFAKIIGRTALGLGEVFGIALSAGSIVAAGAGAAVYVSCTTAMSIAFGGAGIAAAEAGSVVSIAALETVGAGALAAGPVAIILIAVAIGVTAGIQAFTTEQSINDLNNLSNTLTQVTNNSPDLNAFAIDSTGIGMYKLQATLVSETLPDVPSTAPLPAHRPGTDWNLVVGTLNTSTLTYQDWDSAKWSAQTWGGWFVETCTGGTPKCDQADSISGSIRYLDWSGVKWTASRVGSNFVNTKGEPGATDKPCPADVFAGVSLGPDFSHCSSYFSTSIPLMDGTGNQVRVSLSPLTAPVFSGPTTLPFTPGVASTQTLTASGNPNPTICYVSGVLPPGFSLNGGNCGLGTYQLSFNGNATAADGNYPLVLSASNGVAPQATQTFSIDVDQHLGITSPSVLNGTSGKTVNFLVTTTGNPPPKLTLDPLIGLDGLSFKDNGNGTATIRGIPTSPYSFLGCAMPCGITASNSQGSVLQVFGINMAPPPSAFVAFPTSAQFTAGIPNSILVQTTGATTPITWLFQAPVGAPWLSLQPNLDGTAVLSGIPPAGTSGQFTFQLEPVASGTLGDFQTYTVNVVSTPLFSSPNAVTFTVGNAGSFPISVNTGTIGLNGTLPKGLAFAGGSSATIAGTPAVGTGGQYNVTLTGDAGALGSATQSLLLNVNEGATITSPNLVTLFSQVPSAVTVATLGYPSTSTHPVSLSSPPTDPTQGDGMYFTVTGLPASLHFSNLNAQGLATGTLSITGIPTDSDIGAHKVQITAQNGVGAAAQQALTLEVYPVNGSGGANLLTAYTLGRDARNNVVVTTVVANAGGTAAQNVAITSAKIGTASGTVYPASVASIAPAGTATFTITFPAASLGAHGTLSSLVVTGSYNAGTFNSGGRIVLP